MFEPKDKTIRLLEEEIIKLNAMLDRLGSYNLIEFTKGKEDVHHRGSDTLELEARIEYANSRRI